MGGRRVSVSAQAVLQTGTRFEPLARHLPLCRPRGTRISFAYVPTVETVGFLVPSRKAGLGFSGNLRGNSADWKGALPAILAGGIINGMKLRLDRSKRVIFPKTSAKTKPPSMIQVDGLWVHQGTAEPAANWKRVLDDIREERIRAVLKP